MSEKNTATVPIQFKDQFPGAGAGVGAENEYIPIKKSSGLANLMIMKSTYRYEHIDIRK